MSGLIQASHFFGLRVGLFELVDYGLEVLHIVEYTLQLQ